MRKKIVLGLTGGIASGKSTVLKEFKRLGCRVFDCDRIARDLVLPGKPALKKIKKEFGAGVFASNGVLERKKLGRIVFGDAVKRRALEKILHPEIIKTLQQKIDRVRSGIVVADIPLLYELDLQKMVDKVVVVYVPLRVQYERLLERNRISRRDARLLIGAQMPLARKKELADHIVDNSGGAARTRSQARKIFKYMVD